MSIKKQRYAEASISFHSLKLSPCSCCTFVISLKSCFAGAPDPVRTFHSKRSQKLFLSPHVRPHLFSPTTVLVLSSILKFTQGDCRIPTLCPHHVWKICHLNSLPPATCRPPTTTEKERAQSRPSRTFTRYRSTLQPRQPITVFLLETMQSIWRSPATSCQ